MPCCFFGGLSIELPIVSGVVENSQETRYILVLFRIREKECLVVQEEWIAYVNGEYVPQSKAKLSIFDHGVLYGAGVFDTCCAWNGYIFKLDQHVDRLFRSIHTFQIDMPLSKEELKSVIIKVVETNRAKNQYIKCLVTRGVGPQPLLSPAGCKASVVVFSRPYLSLVELGEEEKVVKVRITSIRRTPPQCLDPKATFINQGESTPHEFNTIQDHSPRHCC